MFRVEIFIKGQFSALHSRSFDNRPEAISFVTSWNYVYGDLSRAIHAW